MLSQAKHYATLTPLHSKLNTILVCKHFVNLKTSRKINVSFYKINFTFLLKSSKMTLFASIVLHRFTFLKGIKEYIYIFFWIVVVVVINIMPQMLPFEQNF